jgi:hypothetical protein
MAHRHAATARRREMAAENKRLIEAKRQRESEGSHPAPPLAILIGANQTRSEQPMPRNELLEEVAGLRLVTVHLLAFLSPDERRGIAQSIEDEVTKAQEGELGVEAAMNPYRQSADDILAHAERLANRPK